MSDDYDAMMVVAACPTTSGRVLEHALRFAESFFDERAPSPESHKYRNELYAAILRNPNLPTDLLRLKMADGYVDAWLNPSAPLALLECPMPDEERLDGLWNALHRLAQISTYGPTCYSPGMKVDAQHLRGRAGWRELCAMYPDDIRHLVHDPSTG